jgi:hypothetical protein
MEKTTDLSQVTTLVVICTSSCKCNYHTILTMTIPEKVCPKYSELLLLKEEMNI